MTVESVANQIIRRQGRLTTLKLQKLTYYANAIHLVRHGTPLFDDEVEAFKDGPVIRSLWERYRGKRWVNRTAHLAANAPPLTDSGLAAVEEALTLYGHQTPDWLRFQTHIERPWIDARAKRFPDNKVITNEELIEFYEPVFADPEVADAMNAPMDDGMTSDDIRRRYAEHLG